MALSLSILLRSACR